MHAPVMHASRVRTRDACMTGVCMTGVTVRRSTNAPRSPLFQIYSLYTFLFRVADANDAFMITINIFCVTFNPLDPHEASIQNTRDFKPMLV